MRRLLMSLAIVTVLSCGVGFAALAEEAPAADPAAAPAENKAMEGMPGCKEGGGCCGAAECREKKAAAAAEGEAADCPCKRNKQKPAS